MIPAALAARPEAMALFLDVDGTLLPIEDHPDKVVGDPALTELLSVLADGLDGAVALISGRPLAELDRLFAPLTLPAAGAHGSEFRDGEHPGDNGVPPPLAESLLLSVESFVAGNDGLLLERKSRGIALHYRRRPELESECRTMMQTIADDTGPDYRLLAGKMVLELSPAGHDKGRAIERFLEQSPFLGRLPVFIGDDVTDEAGFAAVNRLGGHSIRVGSTDDSKAVATLPDVTAVRDWLNAVADSLRVSAS